MNKNINQIQKCMFGVHLKKYSDEWIAANPNTVKEAYTGVVRLSRPNLYRAYKGAITFDNMKEIAQRLDKPLEEMIQLDMKSFWLHFKTRMKEDSKFARQIISFCMSLYFMLLYAINDSLLHLSLIVIFMADILQNASNLWRLKLNLGVTEEKVIRGLNLMKIVLIILALIWGVQNQF